MLQAVEFYLFVAALAAAFCQLGIPVAGIEVPVATMVLAVACGVFVFRRLPKPPVPAVSIPSLVFLITSAAGICALSRFQSALALKEMVLLAEIFVAATYLFQNFPSLDRGRLTSAIAVLGLLLLGLKLFGLHEHRLLVLSDAKLGLLSTICLPFILACIARHRSAATGPKLLVLAAVSGYSIANGGLLLVWMLVFGYMAWRLRSWRHHWSAVGLLVFVIASVVPIGPRPNAWTTLKPTFADGHPRRMFIEYKAAFLAPETLPLGGGLGRYKDTINELQQYLEETPHPQDQKIPADSNCQYLLTMVEAGAPAAVMLFLLLSINTLRLHRNESVHRQRDREELMARGGADRTFSVVMAGASLALCFGAFFCVVLSRGTGIWLGAILGCSMSCLPAIRPLRASLSLAALLVVAAASIGVVRSYNHEVNPYDPISSANRLVRHWLNRGVAAEPELEIVVLDDDGEDAYTEVVIEAEAATKLTAPFAKVPANDASADWVIEIPEGSGKGKGEATYQLEVPEDGHYHFVARVYWHDGCSNSLSFVHGAEPYHISSERFSIWHELVSKKRVFLKRGTVDVAVRNREDGIKLDWWGIRLAPD